MDSFVVLTDLPWRRLRLVSLMHMVAQVAVKRSVLLPNKPEVASREKAVKRDVDIIPFSRHNVSHGPRTAIIRLGRVQPASHRRDSTRVARVESFVTKGVPFRPLRRVHVEASKAMAKTAAGERRLNSCP